jgi:hypothetical protein
MSFIEFCAGIRSPLLREVAAHWSKAKAGKRLPAWKNIDPIALARHLPNLWSWRYEADHDRFVGRLAGEEINELFGRNLRGVPMEEFFAGCRYETIFERHKRVVSGPCVMRQRGLVFNHVGRLGSGERIILPLSGDGLRADGIIGATVYGPRWSGAAERNSGTDYTAEELVFLPLD